MVKEKDEDGSSIECSECIKSALVASPKIHVWTSGANKLKKTQQPQTKPTKRGYVKYLVLGIISLVLGVVTLIWKPYDVCMAERLELRRGFPPYEWWVDPPDEVKLSIWIFNVTNSNEFMDGTDSKLKFQEIGPIVYREKLTHSNIVFNDNSTMSYTANRQLILLPEESAVQLDTKVMVPNLAVLGISSFLWNSSFAMKLGFNVLVGRAGSKPITEKTIQDLLWNFTDPVIVSLKAVTPHLLPTTNFGLLKQIYENNTDRFTVLMGRENGPRNFFKVDKLNGRPGINVWNNQTCDSVQGSSEGVNYHQFVEKQDELLYLRKTFCRVAKLHYSGDEKNEVMSGMKIYRYDLSNDTYERPEDGNECYQPDGSPPLPSGVTDASPCYYDFPIASSNPHFMHSVPTLTEKIEGMTPDYESHSSYVYLEPNTGVPFTATARTQISLVMRPMKSGFQRIKRFHNMILPLFWMEYKQVSLPWKISAFIYMNVIIIKNYQTQFSIFLILLSLMFFYLGYVRRRSRKSSDNVIYSSLGQINQETKVT